METEQQFQFGITIDNGDSSVESARDMVKQGNPNKKTNKKINSQSSTSATTDTKQQDLISHPSSQNYVLSRATHPKLCLATILFKGSAFFVYFFMGYLISNVITFIFTVILSALDFWVVKNLSGRLLVGLKWWTQEDHKGNQVWKFQSAPSHFVVNSVDRSFFWTSLIAGTVVWGFFLFINLLQLDLFQALLMGINFGLSATNLYGYYLCRGEHKKKLGNLKDQIKTAGLMKLAGAIM